MREELKGGATGDAFRLSENDMEKAASGVEFEKSENKRNDCPLLSKTA